ncbi:MAG: 50S ribosomal protein L11 methyltransferase [Chloroflexota bacterium]|nr:50S ribosomal protein L11 methyltransferase [Chloroflexota bacterium]
MTHTNLSDEETVWLELRVEADREAVEAVSELFARHGYQHGLVVQEPIIDDLSWGEYVTDPSKPVTLLTYVREDEAGETSLRSVQEGLWHLGRIRPVGELQIRRTRERDWTDTWKSYYRVMRVGERIVIKPSWLPYEPQPDDLVIDLDPGMAFGTGLHPTTRLCLRAIEEELEPGARTLDLGSGSGILTVALAKLGASEVVAVDTDPVAVDATRATALRNGVEGRVRAGLGSLEATEGTFDFIAANIIAGVIVQLAEGLASRLSPGGKLVASGIIEDRYEEVALALTAAGLRLQRLLREGDWVAIVAKADSIP